MFTTDRSRLAFQKPRINLGLQGSVSRTQVNHPENISFGNAAAVASQIKSKVPLAIRLAEKVPEKWFRSSFFKNLAELGNNNQPLLDTIVTLGLTTTLRPMAILATPGAERENKEYSAAQSICSGIVSFLFGFIIYTRLKNAINNTAKLAATNPNIKFPLPDSNDLSTFSTVVNSSVKTFFTLFEGTVLFALVPLIMANLFPKRNKKMDLAPVYATKLSDDQKRIYQKFMDQSLSQSPNAFTSSNTKRSDKALWI